MTESPILKAAKDWAEWNGLTHIRNNTGKGWFVPYMPDQPRPKGGRWIEFGRKGSGDLVCCSPSGRYVEIETKGDGKQSESQELWQYEITKRNGLYILTRSLDDLEAIKGEL